MPNGGRFIQSSYGTPAKPGNFEALVLESNNIVHYWRDNTSSSGWHKTAVVSSQATGDACLIQSTYVGKPGMPANFEAVILEGSNLVHYYRDNSNGNVWHKTDVITSKATGAGALIQSNYIDKPGAPGNFEVVVPEGTDLVHYWRDNSNGNVWKKGGVVMSSCTGPAAFIQGNYGSPHGNFELVVNEGLNLVHYYRDNSGSKKWSRTVVISSKSLMNGPGALIQGSYGSPHGNFELLVFEEGYNLVHFWRNNTGSTQSWTRTVVITGNANGPGTLIQSTYGTPANPGNLEVLVVRNSHALDHFWRNDSVPAQTWSFSMDVSTTAMG
jgi:hypothetical protein